MYTCRKLGANLVRVRTWPPTLYTRTSLGTNASHVHENGHQLACKHTPPLPKLICRHPSPFLKPTCRHTLPFTKPVCRNTRAQIQPHMGTHNWCYPIEISHNDSELNLGNENGHAECFANSTPHTTLHPYVNIWPTLLNPTTASIPPQTGGFLADQVMHATCATSSTRIGQLEPYCGTASQRNLNVRRML